MKARSIARELALLAWYQANNNLPWFEEQLDGRNLSDMMTSAVRTLTTFAQEQLEDGMNSVLNVRDWLERYQDDHKDNENIPYEAPTSPVVLPNTQEFSNHLDHVIKAANAINFAMELPQLQIIGEREDVENYVRMLGNNLSTHYQQIQELMQDNLNDWRVERLNRLDRCMMELAVSEMMATQHVDVATIIDEALNLAKRYSNEESHKLINGTLSSVAAVLRPAIEA